MSSSERPSPPAFTLLVTSATTLFSVGFLVAAAMSGDGHLAQNTLTYLAIAGGFAVVAVLTAVHVVVRCIYDRTYHPVAAQRPADVPSDDGARV